MSAHDSCVDCAGRGTLWKPCPGCGAEREPTAEDHERQAFWRQREAAKNSCQVYARHPNVTCSLGTRGCPLYHGR